MAIKIGGILYPSQEWYDTKITAKGKQAVNGQEVAIQKPTTIPKTTTTQPLGGGQTTTTPKPTDQVSPQIEQTVKNIQQGVTDLTKKVETEGVTNAQGATVIPPKTTTPKTETTGTTPKTGDMVGTKTETNSVDKINQDLTANFDKMMKDFQTSQDKLSKQQEDLMKQMGETMNTQATQQFQDMQQQTKDAYQKYFDQQQQYIQTLQNQPSVLDQLNQFREQQGLPQMEAQLAKADQAVLDVEGMMTNLEQDIRTRTDGMPMSESAVRRLQAMENAPLAKQMDELLRSRSRISAGLEQKQSNVQQFLSASQQDLQNKQNIAETQLGFSKEQAGFQVDIATQAFDMSQKLQDNLLQVQQMGLDLAQQNANTQMELSKMGFDFYSQMMAEQKVGIQDQEAYQQQLVLEQLKSDLQVQNPQIQSVQDFTDQQGNVTLVTTYKNGEQDVSQLGQVNSGKTTSQTATQREQAEIKSVTDSLTNFGQRDYVSGGYYQEVRAGSTISPTEFDKKFSYLLSDEDRQKLGITKVDDISQWEEKKTINQWLADTEGGLNLSPDEQSSQLRMWGYNPEDFGIY